MAEGEYLSLDGTTGEVVRGEVPLAESRLPDELTTVLAWADEIRAGRLGVRANADNAVDAARAREWGAEGIGLCRTEHQFLGDRLPLVRAHDPGRDRRGGGRGAGRAAGPSSGPTSRPCSRRWTGSR